MPISKYYHGHGEEVMSEMKKKYGDRAENVFYATANAKKQKPKDDEGAKPKGFYRRDREVK
jgi:hypothetical protein